MRRSLLIAMACGAAMVGFAALAASRSLDIASARLWTPPAITTNGYEASPAFAPNGREMYYIGASKTFTNFRIYTSSCQNGQWSEGRPAAFVAPAPVIEADPFITPDGRRLFFVSARHDPQNEDFDIYYVDRTKGGSWGEPVRLPSPVNSSGSELLPRVDGSGRLYFGSSRPGGYGQSDIYTAVETSPGIWHVDNVGPPVSTKANEYEAEISRDGRLMIVVADRGDRSHLFLFRRQTKRWNEVGRVPARNDVFQVGPTLSPKSERLLFAQSAGTQSGEIFLIDLQPGSKEPWPPKCR